MKVAVILSNILNSLYTHKCTNIKTACIAHMLYLWHALSCGRDG
jgi:hypothetical protein